MTPRKNDATAKITIFSLQLIFLLKKIALQFLNAFYNGNIWEVRERWESWENREILGFLRKMLIFSKVVFSDCTAFVIYCTAFDNVFVYFRAIGLVGKLCQRAWLCDKDNAGEMQML